MRIPYPLRVCISRSHFKRSWKGAVTKLFSILGITWTGLEIFEYFIPQLADAVAWWDAVARWMIAVPSLVVGVRAYWPNLSVRSRLHGQDIGIEITVDDIFNFDDAMVISTNSTFETRISDGPISRQSLQGQYTEKYYKDREQDLANDLRVRLRDVEPIRSRDVHAGDQPEYDIGTVATVRSVGRTAHMIAVARINEYGTASSSRDDILQALGKLWHYVGQRGELEPLAIPVLGTGRSRVLIPREEMIREIIKSFVAACSEKRFCDKLVIVVSEDDYHKHQMNLQELGNYLSHICRYTSLMRGTDAGEGIEVL